MVLFMNCTNGYVYLMLNNLLKCRNLPAGGLEPMKEQTNKKWADACQLIKFNIHFNYTQKILFWGKVVGLLKYM